MATERYPGEGRGLRFFLEELLPVVARDGRHAMLLHAIRRALDVRRAGPPPARPPALQPPAAAATPDPLDRAPRPPPTGPSGPGGGPARGRAHASRAGRALRDPARGGSQHPLRVELCHEEPPAAPVSVTIEAAPCRAWRSTPCGASRPRSRPTAAALEPLLAERGQPGPGRAAGRPLAAATAVRPPQRRRARTRRRLGAGSPGPLLLGLARAPPPRRARAASTGRGSPGRPA